MAPVLTCYGDFSVDDVILYLPVFSPLSPLDRKPSEGRKHTPVILHDRCRAHSLLLSLHVIQPSIPPAFMTSLTQMRDWVNHSLPSQGQGTPYGLAQNWRVPGPERQNRSPMGKPPDEALASSWLQEEGG